VVTDLLYTVAKYRYYKCTYYNYNFSYIIFIFGGRVRPMFILIVIIHITDNCGLFLSKFLIMMILRVFICFQY